MIGKRNYKSQQPERKAAHPETIETRPTIRIVPAVVPVRKKIRHHGRSEDVDRHGTNATQQNHKALVSQAEKHVLDKRKPEPNEDSVEDAFHDGERFRTLADAHVDERKAHRLLNERR